MVCETFTGDTFIHRTDPVLRVIGAVTICVLLALVSRPEASTVGLAFGFTLCVLARLPILPLFKRLMTLNLFMAVLTVVFALTMGGKTTAVGPLAVSVDGLIRGGSIVLRANAIMLVFTPLISTMDVHVLGYALQQLRVPRRLTLLLLFTVRYIDVLHHQYARFRRCMRARCFRPSMDIHTYRTFGCLIGMILVSSIDRSERVLAAMKCRGFDGTFPEIGPQRQQAGAVEATFSLGCFLIFFLIAGFEWIW